MFPPLMEGALALSVEVLDKDVALKTSFLFDLTVTKEWATPGHLI